MTGVPLNIDWQQILLHLFNFTILVGALYILLYKPVKDFMAKRETYYADMDNKAEAALSDAEEQKRIYEDKVTAFDDEVKAEKSKARQEIEELRKREIEAAHADAEKILADAKAEAGREKAEIISSAQKEIRDLVTDAMDKLSIGESASDAFDQFLDAAENGNSGR